MAQPPIHRISLHLILQVWLFNDMLVYGKELGSGLFEKKGVVKLKGAKVQDIADTEALKNTFVMVEGPER